MSAHDKIERDEVTINIGMPRPLHRRLSITCAVMDVSLKAALVAGAALWIDENAHAVATALPGTQHVGAKSRTKGDRDDDGSEGPSGERAADRDADSAQGAETDSGALSHAAPGVPRTVS